MAYLFLGIFLVTEGLAKLGLTVPAKEIIQGICLIIAGTLWIFGAI